MGVKTAKCDLCQEEWPLIDLVRVNPGRRVLLVCPRCHARGNRSVMAYVGDCGEKFRKKANWK